MISLVIVLVATGSVVTFAKRLKFVPGVGGVLPRTMTVPSMQNLASTYTPASAPNLRMGLASTANSETNQLWSNRSGMHASIPGPIKAGGTWYAPPKTSHQRFPPTVVHDTDPSRARYGFTKHWAKLFEESKAISKMHRQGGTPYNMDAKAKALRNMRDVVAQATAFYGQLKSPLRMSSEDRRLAWLHHGSDSDDMRSSQRLLTRIQGLEMVGMVPKSSLSLVLSDSIIRDLVGDSKDIDSLVKQVWQPGMPLLSTPEKLDTFDASVQALGVLSREKLQDDARGSLRKQIVMRYGNEFFDKASSPQQFDVFAIEGLVDAPGLSISAARVFMSNIAQYAQQEQKVVVVPDRAYLGHHGPDLTEYYERLGFQKVEMQGYAPAQVLLYVGFPRDLSPLGLKMMAEDSSVENEQIMVSMNLWTGLAGM